MKTQNPIIGRARGSFGGAIFSSWKGQNVVRSKPLTVENPRTDAQIIQRNRLTVMLETFRKVSGVANLGFKELAVGKSAYNAFMSENTVPATLNTTGTNVMLNPVNLIMGKGSITQQTVNVAVISDSDTSIDLTWSNDSDPGQSDSDRLVVMVAKVVGGDYTFFQFITSDLRSDEAASLTIPAAASGDGYFVYPFFIKADGTKVSDQDYNSQTVS